MLLITVYFSNMKLLYILILLFSMSYAQNSIIDEYVQNITIYNQDAMSYTYPVNSDSYTVKSTEDDYKLSGEFDFIICGAGSAGAVVANRLSEIKQWRILLIEAGDWENNITDIPAETVFARPSKFNWGYNISSQEHAAFGFINNSFVMPRGKAIGGTSVTNGMFAVRGNAGDFDKWASLGNPGWSYQEVLPYFKKLENVTINNTSPTYRGKKGNVNIQLYTMFDDVGQAILDASAELGRPINNDYNGKSQFGSGILQMTQNHGRRDSTGKAYITPITYRKNLVIIRKALVTKIHIHKITKKAFGVTFLKNGKYQFVKSEKEIIVCAGAVNSPQLLMLSGVGPKNQLKAHNIEVIKNLPVGENLWDHIMYDIQSYTVNYPYTVLPLRTQVELYLNGTGPLTTNKFIKALSFYNIANPSSAVPDTEQIFLSGYIGSRPYSFYEKFTRYSVDSYNYVIKPIENQSQIQMWSVLLHPKSRGSVTLKSNNPLDFPIINPNYFSNPDDIQSLINAVKDQGNFIDTKSLQKYNATAIKTIHPLCNHTEWGSDEYYNCMIPVMSETVFHLGGTCKMGTKTDPTSVVDANLKVHGIRNLRVADTSVIPVTISGHTNLPAIMIGEKLGDIIKKAYGVL